MTDKTSLLRLEDVKSQASVRQRVMIRPSVEIKAKTPADRERVAVVARRVIAEHRDVLVALKDR